jgi:Transcriptional regulator, AbiEi antitoxin, Type IV TA system
MLEKEVIEAFEPLFRHFLNDVGGTLTELRRVPLPARPDLLIDVEIRGKQIKLVAEARAQGEPRYIRQAADQLRDFMAHYPGAYPIIIAPYISDPTADLLRRKEISYFDFAGNALIDAGPIYIRLAGKPNPKPAKKKLRSLFAPKTSRVIRVLLTNPSRTWQLQDLAAEAEVSIGLASRLKERLTDLEFLRETTGGISLAKPGDLLDLWAKAYSYQQNEILKYYAPSSPAEVEARLSQFAQPRRMRYGLTMCSGASRVARVVRYHFASFYFSGSTPELELELQLNPVESDANVWVLRPHDEGVFYGVQTVDTLSVVSNVQLYLDLINNYQEGGRCGEQAMTIRMQLLKY